MATHTNTMSTSRRNEGKKAKGYSRREGQLLPKPEGKWEKRIRGGKHKERTCRGGGFTTNWGSPVRRIYPPDRVDGFKKER